MQRKWANKNRIDKAQIINENFIDNENGYVMTIEWQCRNSCLHSHSLIAFGHYTFLEIVCMHDTF